MNHWKIGLILKVDQKSGFLCCPSFPRSGVLSLSSSLTNVYIYRILFSGVASGRELV